MRSGSPLTRHVAHIVLVHHSFARLLRDPVYRGWGVPRGDGDTVLVLPGLFAGDNYLRPLRGWLRRLGYGTMRSGIERNPGLSERLIEALGERGEAEFQRSGRKLSLIGHSMGGAQACAIARRHPQAVRHVITPGAPIATSRPLPVSVRDSAIASLRREFADITVSAAEKVINQSLDRQAHQRLIQEVLADSGIDGAGRQ